MRISAFNTICEPFSARNKVECAVYILCQLVAVIRSHMALTSGGSIESRVNLRLVSGFNTV